MTRRLLLLLAVFLYRRLEAALDGYKSGTKASSTQTSQWALTFARLACWLLGWRPW